MYVEGWCLKVLELIVSLLYRVCSHCVTVLSLCRTFSLQAIHHLLLSHNPSNREDIYKAVLDQLTTPPQPSLLTPSHRPLVTAALDLLFYINIISMSSSGVSMRSSGVSVWSSGVSMSSSGVSMRSSGVSMRSSGVSVV